jgi:UDP:flavonoid glycosyltransferase YjiC (YdhE family)
VSGRPPCLAFAPASGPGGSGEAYRCLALARAVADRRPDAEIHVLLHREASVERDERFAYHALSDTPARAGDEVLDTLGPIRPDLVYFDCTGRVAQFRALKRAGARVAWGSDRPNKRLKGFRPRQMRCTDLHLVVDVSGGAPALKWYERGLMRLAPGCSVELVRGIVAEPDADALPDGLPPATPYAVFVAGGGGYEVDGRPVPEILVDAAESLKARTGLEAVVVMGPQYRGGLREHDQVTIVDALPTRTLGALLANAAVTITGAGSMLSAQVLAAERPAVMFPAGGNDQAQRIQDLSAAGLVERADADAGSLTEAAAGLVESKEKQRAMAAAQSRLAVGEATGQVAERLLALAESGPEN